MWTELYRSDLSGQDGTRVATLRPGIAFDPDKTYKLQEISLSVMSPAGTYEAHGPSSAGTHTLPTRAWPTVYVDNDNTNPRTIGTPVDGRQQPAQFRLSLYSGGACLASADLDTQEVAFNSQSYPSGRERSPASPVRASSPSPRW